MVTHAVGLEPGSEAWRAWLEQTGQKTFRFTTAAGSFSGRREAKAERTYWYAYRKSRGHLSKAYLGRSEDLTLERLAAVAAQLSGGGHQAAAAEPGEVMHSDVPKPTTPLIGRARDVAAVVEQLLEPGTRLLTLTGP